MIPQLFVSQSPVTFKVAVPLVPDKAEWKLKGQMLPITLQLRDSVSVIKAKIHEATGLPPGKQKLHWEVCYCYYYTPLQIVRLQQHHLIIRLQHLICSCFPQKLKKKKIKIKRF